MDVDAFYESFEEFFCVFIQSVLYAAEIYPRSTFKAVKHYDAACWQSVHPGVSEWSEITAKLCFEAIKDKECKTLSFVVLHDGHPEERFVIDVRHLSSALKNEFHPRNLIAQFRATLVSLAQMHFDNPQDCEDRTITVVFTAEEPFIASGASSPWIVGERYLRSTRTRNVRPIRFIEGASLSMGVYYVARDAI